MINTSKPTTALTNDAKVSFAETWGSISSTWESEARTWIGCVSLISNSSLSTEPIWSVKSFPWLLSLPWEQAGGIINTSKPI